MHNAIDSALRHVRASVPYPLLSAVFSSQQSFQGPIPVSIEQGIINKVIAGRVLHDCSLVGGKVKEITLLRQYLESTPVSQHDWYVGMTPWSIYRIPPDIRDNVDISEIMAIKPPIQVSGGMGSINFGAAVTPLTAAEQVLESYAPNSYIQVPRAELVSGDMIRLTPSQISSMEFVVVVRLAYDLELNGLNSSAILPFVNLVVCAVKAYIYNELIIRLDQGQMLHGYELGSIRSIVESYASENERYMELVDQFSGGAMLDSGRIAVLAEFML